MTPGEQERFDALLEEVIETLPARVRQLLDEVPLIVMDRPSAEMLAELVRDGVLEAGDDGLDLCGLHTGCGLTERSIEAAEWEAGGGLENIHLFREGIVALAGGWQPRADYQDDDDTGPGGENEVYEEIRVTLLHELGHHFGLDEDDLEGLG